MPDAQLQHEMQTFGLIFSYVQRLLFATDASIHAVMISFSQT